MTRLTTVAALRSATMPSEMAPYVSALSGFSRAAIDQACEEIEGSPVAEYESRWPELGRVKEACRRIQEAMTRQPRKFYCQDCESECGMLFFDAPGGGRRLRGADLVGVTRYARPCPCGGTETDWRSLEQDRAAHPQRYSTLADVFRSAMTGVGR